MDSAPETVSIPVDKAKRIAAYARYLRDSCAMSIENETLTDWADLLDPPPPPPTFSERFAALWVPTGGGSGHVLGENDAKAALDFLAEEIGAIPHSHGFAMEHCQWCNCRNQVLHLLADLP